ncbi:MAG: DUF2284 domain-containing protein [Clostridia bacterium]|nr:DUF2284 domain-containing protein [Clostridia bacterium]
MRDELLDLTLAQGFDRAQWIDGDQIVLDRSFRSHCASNACGLYGRCYMCPPDVGEIDALMAELRRYRCGILYQSVFPLEDSFDFEGMQAGGQMHSARSYALDGMLKNAGYTGFLHLTKGGCGLCVVCAKTQGKPCRFQEKALSSLEAYGVNVSATAKNAGLPYIAGANTVTYFGLILFKENALCRD